METRTSGVPANLPVEKLIFRYDHQGRRTAKEAWKKVAGVYQKQGEWDFMYDGWNLIAEGGRLPIDYVLLRTYHWGLDLSGTLQGAGGVGGLLMMRYHDAPGGATQTFAYGYDGNGNVTGLLNVTDGQQPKLDGEYEYGPFGEPVRATESMTGVNPFQFSTKYQERETGLLYYGRRYHQPAAGRWFSRDPLGQDGSENLYSFARNDSINRVDLWGLKDFKIVFTGAGPEDSLGNGDVVTIAASVNGNR